MTDTNTTSQATPHDRILRIRDLMALLAIGRHTVGKWEKVGALPPRRVFGPGMTGWFESEINEWLRTRPRINAQKVH